MIWKKKKPPRVSHLNNSIEKEKATMKMVHKEEVQAHTFVGVVDWYLDQAAVVFPLWSVLTYLFVVFLVLVTKSLVQRSNLLRPHLHIVNEFLGTFGWICISLEGVVVGVIWSRNAGILLLFIRLFLAPYLFKDAYISPCGALFDIFKDKPYSTQGFVTFLKILAAQLAGTLCAMACIVRLVWRFLAETVSDDHFHFNGLEQSYYLQVWHMYGFGIEFITTALCFSFRFFLDMSVLRVFLESSLITYLVYMVSPLTGAMMNPLVALSLLLPWNSLDLFGCVEHFFVFWIAPFMATFLMISLFKIFSRVKYHAD